MQVITSHTAENRMTPSAVAACMAPLLLRPLLAGECELDDDFDMNGDSSAQLLAAANAANNAQAIITSLLEEYEIITSSQEGNSQRCSLSSDSQIGDTGSEESTDDVNTDVKDNGYHDAENDAEPDMNDDNDERVLSGKLSESSGYAGSDLYEYKVFFHPWPRMLPAALSTCWPPLALSNTPCFPPSIAVCCPLPQEFADDDSDPESPHDNQSSATKTELPGAKVQHNEQASAHRSSEKSLTEKDASSVLATQESPLSMGEILSSLHPGTSFPAHVTEYNVDRFSSKVNGSHTYMKRTNFWGRNNARKNQPLEQVDSSGEEE
ncbi:hypothetical protein BHM03_00027897 [Ensete ventricosum]|nr:hypothetical protein BHM03_00027897 [Ensete ventricosum]